MRIFVIFGAILFCVWNAPEPDPRVAAARIEAAAPSQPPDDPGDEFYCPMHAGVRSANPGFCPRCGMKLVDSIQDVTEYPLSLTVEPSPPVTSRPVRLTFGIEDPNTQRPVRSFEVVHEKLYHVFVVSHDPTFFVHTHPERQGDEDFHLDLHFPKPGMYRILSDFYPSGGTPQSTTSTVLVPGPSVDHKAPDWKPDTAPQHSENAHVNLLASHFVARQRASMLFRITPGDALEPYLGAMGHMLAVSSDLTDLDHNHALQAADGPGNGAKDLNFSMIFPHAGIYRVWVQFQRKGVVNTAAFNVPVDEPK